MKLKERARYDFLVIKLVETDDERYFLLKGPDNKRYLLPEKYYTVYGIMTGSVINCRIDKINCKGKVFLEPEHPYYREGNEYEFRLLEQQNKPDQNGKLLIVGDEFGLRHEVFVPGDCEISASMVFRIDKIKKGCLFLKPL